MPYSLGIDLGTSSIKVSILDLATGKCLRSATSPASGEMEIIARNRGWAEQNPMDWLENFHRACQQINLDEIRSDIRCVGIAYQMHGMVLCDGDLNPTCNSIIWCDDRAIEKGQEIRAAVGDEYCRNNLLNAPGNFTLSKLKWVQEMSPQALSAAKYMMLAGDWLAARLTNVPATSASGLSEMIAWDFAENRLSNEIFSASNLPSELIPDLVPTFGASGQWGNIPITYRAGDQPNNALAVGACGIGDAAANAGTSGVIFAVSERAEPGLGEAFNRFLDVNGRIGSLLCINGMASSYQWLRRTVFPNLTYSEMSTMAAESPAGSKGLIFSPFGQGAERMFGNRSLSAGFYNINYQQHGPAELARSVLEGTAFALAYGVHQMVKSGIPLTRVRAGNANMFLSEIFAQTFSEVSGLPVQLVESDGSVGAAMGAAFGLGTWNSSDLQRVPQPVSTVEPGSKPDEAINAAFRHWSRSIEQQLSS